MPVADPEHLPCGLHSTGVRRGYRGTGHFGRGVVQGLDTDYAAAARQLDAVDEREPARHARRGCAKLVSGGGRRCALRRRVELPEPNGWIAGAWHALLLIVSRGTCQPVHLLCQLPLAP